MRHGPFLVILGVLVGCSMKVTHTHRLQGQLVCRPIFGGYICRFEPLPPRADAGVP